MFPVGLLEQLVVPLCSTPPPPVDPSCSAAGTRRPLLPSRYSCPR